MASDHGMRTRGPMTASADGAILDGMTKEPFRPWLDQQVTAGKRRAASIAGIQGGSIVPQPARTGTPAHPRRGRGGPTPAGARAEAQPSGGHGDHHGVP